MAEINEILKEAEILYKNGVYSDAAKKCIEVIKTGECLKEAYLLWSKSYLFMLPATEADNDEYTKTFFNAVSKAYSFCDTFEEMFAAEAEIVFAINEWERQSKIKHMDFLTENPTLQNWQTHINTWVPISKLRVLVGVYLVNSPSFIKLQMESGEEPKALRAKYNVKCENGMTDEEKSELYFSTGCKIFDDVSALHEEYKHTSAEALNTVKDRIIGGLCLAPLVMETGIKDGVPDELEKLMKLAALLNYCINAQVYPNGRRIVLLQNSDNDVNKLKKTYQRIKALDPDFVIPEIVIPEPTPAATNSGGCYVATAVYGSYDCPEVWTLRRFRDNTLAETWYGRTFIRTYYAISPALVKWFGETEWFKNMWKPALDKMVKELNDNGVENTAYNDKEW